jgi:hypothetical protein
MTFKFVAPQDAAAARQPELSGKQRRRAAILGRAARGGDLRTAIGS